jgi:hypothetical protein
VNYTLPERDRLDPPEPDKQGQDEDEESEAEWYRENDGA